MDEDIEAIATWAEIFTDPDQLSEVVAKRYDKSESQIQDDITTLVTEWGKESFKAGSALADLMMIVVGPI